MLSISAQQIVAMRRPAGMLEGGDKSVRYSGRDSGYRNFAGTARVVMGGYLNSFFSLLLDVLPAGRMTQVE